MWFQKVSILHLQKVIGKGEGVLKTKLLEDKYEAKQEFPGDDGGGGVGMRRADQNTFHGGSMDVFWNNTVKLIYLLIIPTVL